MPSLPELQHAMRLALGEAGDAPPWVAGDDAAERLAIYRATIRGTLVKALRLAYPAVERLVGPDFFDGAATLFAQAHVADDADLNAYGAAFPAFLRDLPQCASLEYLPDVARLDRAVACALHAPDARPLEPDALAARVHGEQDVHFVAHPSISLLCSPFPVHEIWHAVLARDDARIAGIDLSSGPAHLVVQRIADEAEVVALNAGEWRFAKALLGGGSLALAMEEAGAEVDAAASLARHLAAGRVVGVITDQNKERT